MGPAAPQPPRKASSSLLGRREYLGIVEKQVFRCQGVTRRLLGLARVPPPSVASVDVAAAKARLVAHSVPGFEGSLKIPAAENGPTQWGFGLVALNLSGAAAAGMDQKLAALEALYARSELRGPGGTVSGAWRYARVAW